MSFRNTYIIFLLFFTPIAVFAEKTDQCKITPFQHQVRLVKRANQGMDIYKNQMFVLHDGGTCHVYDMRTHHVLGSFELGSKRAGNHSNTANFGIEKAPGGSFPVLYISLGKPGDKDEFACYVESITRNKGSYSSKLVQTIRMDQSAFSKKGLQTIWGCPNWVVDKERKHLWAFSAIKRTKIANTGPFSNNKYIATKYRLPKLSEGKEVVLKADDVLDQAVMEFDAYATQGGTMRDGMIFYAYGFGITHPDSPTKVRVYNTDTRQIAARYDIVQQVPEEPEDISIYKEKVYLNTNSNKIYLMNIPKKLLKSSTRKKQ